MLRIARLDTPGSCPAFRGIMIRGTERRKIFNDDQDRENFKGKAKGSGPGQRYTLLMDCG